ncbi:DUF1488 domain-containing protein [Shewanella sp. VB17]|uniref:DUF1488 domain-containing protein n=1 Tax=Shewanella sp. VB17 TaxID=2739432 RepID=UPI0015662965|nr:DUF1488 domain-containing protein [Shewanella sp. VB17]NRD71826.1 DUF1488 domain-containing protein [Shewanella sp. VB17]
MNQSILFPDLQNWDRQNQVVIFPVQVQGVNVECQISLAKLVLLSAISMEANQQDMETQILALFDEYRFDIEEEVEKLIEQELFDEYGKVLLL